MDKQSWKDRFYNHKRLSVIQNIIGCKKHGNDFEEYVRLWEELYNDDKDEIENFISQELTRQKEEIIKMVETKN
jgi:hypothetical protein